MDREMKQMEAKVIKSEPIAKSVEGDIKQFLNIHPKAEIVSVTQVEATEDGTPYIITTIIFKK